MAKQQQESVDAVNYNEDYNSDGSTPVNKKTISKFKQIIPVTIPSSTMATLQWKTQLKTMMVVGFLELIQMMFSRPCQVR
jgi:hypothetical protein